MNKILKFPKNFLWGSATSSYQVEGGIENCDWSERFSAGKACDHYRRYEEDFDLLEKMNHNAYRFSVEWSRIEPEEGKFDEREIMHYRKVLSSLKRRGIKTMVTLHHFTSPLWFFKKGGWANFKSVFYFIRFAEKMLKECGDLADFWVTINEPLIYSSKGLIEGSWPPFRKNIFLFMKAIKNQITAHKKIFDIFHKINPGSKVGLAKNNQFFEPFNQGSFLDRASVFLSNYFWNDYFLNQIEKYLDFIGLNYYFHQKVKFPFQRKNDNKIVSDLGWEIYPEGIYRVLVRLKKYGLPIYITENGLADKDDKIRKDFIRDHLFWIYQSIEEGADVRGYFHWSLMDNFEWDKGFEPRFGLMETDYRTLERKIRPSAFYYSEICKTNQLSL